MILKFRFSRIKVFFSLQNLLVLSSVSSGDFISSFDTVISASIGKASASFSLVSIEILKIFLKAMERKRNKHRKIALFPKSKLNSIAKKTFIYF